MDILKKDSQGSSRFNYRSKRKKTNLVLNGLIGIVLLLIVIVGYSIFISGNDKTAAKKDVQTAAGKTSAEKQSVNKIKKDTSTVNKSSTDNSTKTNNEQNTADQSNKSTKSSSSSNQDQNNSNQDQSNSDQVQTVDSPDVSTSTPAASSGQHVTSYDSNSQDWQEMLQAMSSATGVDQGNMTVWFLGSDKGNPGGSVGTISAKDNKQQRYRVYLQWVDGQGYKATKVEQAQ